ncbi:lysis inhibition; accessory protein [Acinetobacter phage 133]|uniref:Lysis inhibition accessory protein n=1 Tax=Acinetobacter phage 133 TaxID=2919552 RepID=D9I6D9_9CAUD|nr:lysis inhibition; accessory protein [Acinetobacter phage 133]ADJ19520.1 rIII lysis inhibition accessory protein [Acinetobacter phage 133]
MEIKDILNIQREAWRKGHDNYGTDLDVLAAIYHFLKRFNHLNPAQKKALESLEKVDNIKYAKRLCSRANKAARHLVVTLK